MNASLDPLTTRVGYLLNRHNQSHLERMGDPDGLPATQSMR